MRQVGDIERISSRIALKSARPRDLLVLRNTLAVLPALQQTLRPATTRSLPFYATRSANNRTY